MKDSAFSNYKKSANIPYFFSEEPQTFTTGANVFRYYPNAHKLAVSLPDYIHQATGETRMGKTVAINVDSLVGSPATLKALLGILCAARDKVDRDTWAALK